MCTLQHCLAFNVCFSLYIDLQNACGVGLYDCFLVCPCTSSSAHVCAGMYGQLGHGNTEKQSTPKLVTELEGSTVYVLSCGNFHTVSAVLYDLCGCETLYTYVHVHHKYMYIGTYVN